MNAIKATFNFREKVNPNPLKARNSTAPSFWRQKKRRKKQFMILFLKPQQSQLKPP